MRFAFQTQPATFIERPNRYLVMARLHATGETVRAHCPDPGRLLELLVPGARVHVDAAPTGPRTTTHTLRFVEHPEAGTLVSVVSGLANALFREALQCGLLAPFQGAATIEPEVRVPRAAEHGPHSRLDYRLTDATGRVCWVEVKSATLVVAGVASFPDAVTERGRRHVRELADLARTGDRAAVCFVVQRPDARFLRPQWERDPAFAQALADAAEAGVECYAWRAHVGLAEAALAGPVEVLLDR